VAALLTLVEVSMAYALPTPVIHQGALLESTAHPECPIQQDCLCRRDCSEIVRVGQCLLRESPVLELQALELQLHRLAGLRLVRSRLPQARSGR
jgi:hypothetical protein